MPQVKDWDRFQHYKDRKPHWIKLYRELLEDRQWHSLSGDAAKLLINLWLLAAEDDDMSGKLPPLADVAFRLRLSEERVSKLLPELSHFLFNKEKEIEKEKERDTRINAIEPLYTKSIDEVDGIVQAWNNMAEAHGLPTVRKATAARRSALRARLAEVGYDEMLAAITKVTQSPFLLGDNKDGWRASFDFILQPSSLTKLLEGQYERSNKPQQSKLAKASESVAQQMMGEGKTFVYDPLPYPRIEAK